MRIAFLTQYYVPELGAPQARLSELAEKFVQRGHDVHVVTALPNYPQGRIYDGYRRLFATERIRGVRVTRSWLHATQSPTLVPRLASYGTFALTAAVAGLTRLSSLDYLLTESPPLFLGPTGYLLSRLKGAKWIFNVSDLWPSSAVDLGVVREGGALRLAEGLERFCYRKAWTVTGQSHEILQGVEDRVPGTRTYHLSNGVDTTRFAPSKAEVAVRQELLAHFGYVRSREDPMLVLYAGLHGLAQGLDQVIDTAKVLAAESEGRPVLIACVGDGPDKAALQTRLARLELNNLRFLPARSRDDIPTLLASVDVALVPLRRRIFGAVPSKIYEAMASGLPVVFLGEGEPAALVQRTGAGYAVEPGKPEAVADLLCRMARDPIGRKVMGERGRAAAEVSFNRNNIAESFIDYLEGRLASGVQGEM